MDVVLAELGKQPHVVALDVDALAKDLGAPRAANMVLLGAMAALLRILEPDALREGIRRVFARKGDAVVESNIKAFDAGLEHAQNKQQ